MTAVPKLDGRHQTQNTMTTKTIKVQASQTAQTERTAVIFERHPDHPKGEVFISGNDTMHIVAPTAEILKRIKDGRLVEVKGSK